MRRWWRGLWVAERASRWIVCGEMGEGGMGG